MAYQELPIEEKRYISTEDQNEIVKHFVSQIKENLKGARLIVQGTEVKTLKEFGTLILKRDGKELSSTCFYAYFDDRFKCTSRLMTMKEIKDGIKEGKKLSFIKIKYTGAGCWGK